MHQRGGERPGKKDEGRGREKGGEKRRSGK